MAGPAAYYLDGDEHGRLHLQHGPIDLVIGIGDEPGDERQQMQRARCFRAALHRFSTVLDELVSEIDLLRLAHSPSRERFRTPVARRMAEAVAQFSADVFITPMAAVAGAVADEVLAAMLGACEADDRPERIYVNNGGDIALHLDGDAEFALGVMREDGASLGRMTISSGECSRGVATSGRGGRSFSLGIADSVTVVASNAAAADAAATLIANAVDLPGHPAVSRAPATSLKDDSDLGDRLVVTGCGQLKHEEIDNALLRGEDVARDFIARGLISRAALFLKTQGRIVMPSGSSNHTPNTAMTAPAVERRHHA